MNHSEFIAICDRLRWRAYRLAVVFGLDRRMADLMYEGGLPVDDEIAAWLSEAASLLDTVPEAVQRMPLRPETPDHMVGRLIAAMVDIDRIDDAAAGEDAFDWLNRLEELIGTVPTKRPRTRAYGGLSPNVIVRLTREETSPDQPPARVFRRPPGEGF